MASARLPLVVTVGKDPHPSSIDILDTLLEDESGVLSQITNSDDPFAGFVDTDMDPVGILADVDHRGDIQDLDTKPAAKPQSESVAKQNKPEFSTPTKATIKSTSSTGSACFSKGASSVSSKTSGLSKKVFSMKQFGAASPGFSTKQGNRMEVHY